MQTLLRAFGVLILVLLAACTQENTQNFPPDDVADPYISTDATVYTPTVSGSLASFEVTATFTNRGQDTLYVETCADDLPFHGWQKYIDGRWLEVEEMIGYACASELKLHELASQETFTKTFQVHIVLPHDVAGFYRLGWVGVYAEADIDAEPAPLAQRVSNVFELK